VTVARAATTAVGTHFVRTGFATGAFATHTRVLATEAASVAFDQRTVSARCAFALYKGVLTRAVAGFARLSRGLLSRIHLGFERRDSFRVDT
jgi:hypothetical protein